MTPPVAAANTNHRLSPKGNYPVPHHHHCPPDAFHRSWDKRLPPVLSVELGDTVTFSTSDALDGVMEPPDWATPHPPTRDRGTQPTIPRGHPLSGPVAVRGACPGDVLVVEVLEIALAEWGWTATGDHGVLGATVTDHTHIQWDLRGPWAVPSPPLAHPIRVPMQPFCGVMGVAPGEDGEQSTIPPRAVGGNLDVRRLVAGSTLFLPVAVDGALFSCGDVHAAQGDGEVSGTGIECAATVTVPFDARRDMEITGPAFIAPAPRPLGHWFGVTGIGPDLMGATRQAVQRMPARSAAAAGARPSASRSRWV